MNGYPKVILYNAVSIDARFDWLNPDLGLFYELAGRFKEDLTLIGSDTILAAPEEIPEEKEDDFPAPSPTPDDGRPLFAVVDSRGRISTWHHWVKQPYWRDAVSLCSKKTPSMHIDYLKSRGIKYLTAGEDKVDLPSAFRILKETHLVNTIRADCGGRLNGALLRSGLVTELHLLVHPCLVGGASPKGLYVAEDLRGPEGIINCRLTGVEQVKENLVLLSYDIVSGPIP